MPSDVSDERPLEHRREGRTGHGIKVEVHIVGLMDVIALRVPLIEVNAAKVHDPEQGCNVVDDGKVDDVARLVLDGTCLEPRGMRLGYALHEEALPARPIGVALHHHRPLGEMWQEMRSHVGVALEQVALRDLFVLPEHLREVGELYAARTEGELRFSLVGDRERPCGHAGGGGKDVQSAQVVLGVTQRGSGGGSMASMRAIKAAGSVSTTSSARYSGRKNCSDTA
jgi:hypothetical protein